MFNQIQVLGNLTKDIELSYNTQTGTAFARGSVATNYKYKTKSGEEKQETTFLNFIANGRLAEICNQYLKKGSKVFLVGRLAQNNYTDKNGGSHTTYQIVVEDIRFLDAKPQDSTSNQVAHQNGTAQVANQTSVASIPEANTASKQEASNAAPAGIPDEVGEKLPF